MDHTQRLGEYLRYRSAIGVRLTELAILVTARQWTQQVEMGDPRADCTARRHCAICGGCW